MVIRPFTAFLSIADRAFSDLKIAIPFRPSYLIAISIRWYLGRMWTAIAWLVMSISESSSKQLANTSPHMKSAYGQFLISYFLGRFRAITLTCEDIFSSLGSFHYDRIIYLSYVPPGWENPRWKTWMSCQRDILPQSHLRIELQMPSASTCVLETMTGLLVSKNQR